MRSTVTLLLLLAVLFANGQTATLSWARQMGGTSWDQGNANVVDASGNVYITGYFDGTADFDPGPGTFNLSSAGGSRDIFILKLDALGNFLWARRIGGSTGFDQGNSIAVDAAGNVYTTGEFQGVLVDFDPGAGVSTLSAVGGYDIFVSKLDASGNFVWARRLGGSSDDFASKIRLGASGEIHLTGNFQGIADFDPSATTFSMTAANRDVFVVKLDAAGTLLWAKQMGGVSADVGNSLAVDASGNVFITGFHSGAADFDPGPSTFNLTTAGGLDVFVCKLDASGNFVWAKSMGGPSQDFGKDIALDASGNVLITGRYIGPADFDPGAATFNLTGNDDLYVCKLDGSGNLIWVKDFQSAGNLEAASLAVDGSGNVYTTGYFSGATDFDPGAGVFTLTPTGKNIYVSKLDGSGNFAWAITVGSSTNNEPMSIALDAADHIYVTGFFCCTSDFDPGAGTANLTASSVDVFAIKLSQTSSLPVKLTSFSAIKCGSSICIKWLTNDELNVSHYEVERSNDGNVFQTIAKTKALNLNSGSYSSSDVSWRTTVYYRLKTVDSDGKILYSNVVQLSLNATAAIALTPNPATNFVVLQTAEKIDRVRVTDINGRLIKTLQPSSGNKIDIQLLPPGIYWMQISIGGETRSYKLVKK